MKKLPLILLNFLIILYVNFISLYLEIFYHVRGAGAVSGMVLFDFSLLFNLLLAVFLLANIWIKTKKTPTKTIYLLHSGSHQLVLFLTSLCTSLVLTLCIFPGLYRANQSARDIKTTAILGIISLIHIILAETILFWNGMIRIFVSSTQLGIKRRILSVICAWIPGLNIYYLTKMIHITSLEAEQETEKWELNQARKESRVCETKYPILMVHGVFFRDFRYLNYWGRIAPELIRNGACVYFGNQQSAASVEECGRELAERIQQVCKETGCEKINIIAHSKGGLDSRSAITHFGAAPYVASLTTINTPHRGCLFADYLLSRIPEKTRNTVARTYNSTLKKLGDHDPDFLCAVTDLTASACEAFNRKTPDMPDVLYESVMSYCKKAKSGKFPLNMSYPLVKHFDGINDGLVSVDSARWGSHFTLIEPAGRRGVSHGDMIDLYRENISGFDVREFYCQIAENLKRRSL